MITLKQCSTLMRVGMRESVSVEDIESLKSIDALLLADWLKARMIASLMHRRLESVWPELSSSLQIESFLVSAENSLHYKALDEILESLSEKNIRPILLKGIALAETVYHETGHRPMVDVDIWVQADYLTQTVESIRRLGYLSAENAERPQALQELMSGTIDLVHPRWNSVGVDLHRSPFNGWWFKNVANIDEAAVLSRKRDLTIGAHSAWQLSPEDLLIHLIVHLSIKSAFIPHTCLRTCFDIAHVVEAYDIDWEKIVENARAWNLTLTVWHVLSIVSTFVTLSGSESALGALRPTIIRQKLLYSVASPGSIVRGRDWSKSKWRFALMLISTDRLSNLANSIFKALWPESGWLDARYGQDATWFHHIQTLWRGG